MSTVTKATNEDGARLAIGLLAVAFLFATASSVDAASSTIPDDPAPSSTSTIPGDTEPDTHTTCEPGEVLVTYQPPLSDQCVDPDNLPPDPSTHPSGPSMPETTASESVASEPVASPSTTSPTAEPTSTPVTTVVQPATTVAQPEVNQLPETGSSALITALLALLVGSTGVTLSWLSRRQGARD